MCGELCSRDCAIPVSRGRLAEGAVSDWLRVLFWVACRHRDVARSMIRRVSALLPQRLRKQPQPGPALPSAVPQSSSACRPAAADTGDPATSTLHQSSCALPATSAMKLPPPPAATPARIGTLPAGFNRAPIEEQVCASIQPGVMHDGETGDWELVVCPTMGRTPGAPTLNRRVWCRNRIARASSSASSACSTGSHLSQVRVCARCTCARVRVC
jgi:hypothetical protein